MSNHDPVHNPAHYAPIDVVAEDGKLTGITPIEFLRGVLTKEQFEGHCLGTVLSYLIRYRKKNGVQDLQKANTYLCWMIEAQDDGCRLTVGEAK